MAEINNNELSSVFVKMHVSAFRSGLVRALCREKDGKGAWLLLCALTTYMDRDGVCYPTRETLAKELGVGDRTIGNWLKTLATFRWHGKPLITVRKRFKPDGTWNNVYTIHPNAHLTIFSGDVWEDEDIYSGEYVGD